MIQKEPPSSRSLRHRPARVGRVGTKTRGETILFSCTSRARRDYKETPRNNFENGECWTHTVDLGEAKRLPHLPLVLSATFEKPLKGGNERFQVDFTMT